jgi:flagellar hook-associated protein 2
MAGVITVGGLATGLDTNSIIQKLVSIERRPLDLLGQRIGQVQGTKEAVASVSGKLSALSSALGGLKTVDGVLVRRASATDDTVLKVSAGAGAARGSTTLTVTQLARGSVAGAAVGVASATSTVATGPGTFQFQVGTGAVQSVAVDATTTLTGLAEAINGLGAGVTASAVNLGTAASPDFRLQIVTAATGASSTIAVVQDDTTLAVQATQAGQDAQFTVSGFAGTFARESNTFADVLPGVTISLRDVGTAGITVDDDADAIVDQVKGVVNAFNDLVAFVDRESTVEQAREGEDVQLGSLAGDSTVRRTVSRVHEIFSAPVAAADGGYVNLASLGLTTQRDGTIGFNESTFRAALGADAEAVAEVFAGQGATGGVADDLAAFLAEATSTGGALSIHTTALDDQIKSLQKQIDVGQRTVDAVEENLRRQFAALESLVSSLQSQSGFLQAALR